MHAKDALAVKEQQQGLDPVRRQEIINLWLQIDYPKDQIERFIAWLIVSDFFRAPCSTEFHLATWGGLAEHSLNVYHLLKEKVERYGLKDVTPSMVIMCGLGHDLCKVDSYVPGTRNVKENGQWVAKKIFKVEDQFPYGHGEKSVCILQDYFQLVEIVKLSIRFHMASWEPGIHFGYPTGFAYREAVKRHPLVTALFTADVEASQILEAGK